MEEYQKQLQEMQRQLAELKQQLAASGAPATSGGTPPSQPAATPTLEERVDALESAVATHDSLKVESESKYPVSVTGLVLFNTFVNTHRVDVPATPTYALRGGGTTGFTMRQTVLGIDARGPHLFGATSRAQIRTDFFGSATNSEYSAGGLIRLRTARASLDWKNTEAFFSYDRTILVPDAPTSLASVAVPALSWSGNLWTWNPQVGVSQSIPLSPTSKLTLQTAFIDVGDPLLPSATSGSASTLAERSRWPGVQFRAGSSFGPADRETRFGLGGYFSPHRAADGSRFDAWAATADLHLPLGKYLLLTSNAYRGQALGGLGGGGYADFIYRDYEGATALRPIDDVGGWAQLAIKTGRFETNLAYGLDNPFSKQIRSRTASSSAPSYSGLTRNSTVMLNTIYSPNAYLQFSLEYKRLQSTFPSRDRYASDAIGLSGAYRF
ncbi:YbaB/EbfC family nucleoid-associated protein [Terriglobus albidus]|uniref:YbaB/EbfC family nucleoid-associated protein n=1 Tax=Terriglobus albidus TaxID=1592106 RepID=A0A5B9EM37_9BACT|nr:YbaB/EbfC family nucleoid-associated protein [Terriglobus albidus]